MYTVNIYSAEIKIKLNYIIIINIIKTNNYNYNIDCKFI